jgi:hypothetical protein
MPSCPALELLLAAKLQHAVLIPCQVTLTTPDRPPAAATMLVVLLPVVTPLPQQPAVLLVTLLPV